MALDSLFAPDQYNLAFLMNLGAHVHLHVIPGRSRERHGEKYTDPHYGSLFGTEERLVSEEILRALADTP